MAVAVSRQQRRGAGRPRDALADGDHVSQRLKRGVSEVNGVSLGQHQRGRG